MSLHDSRFTTGQLLEAIGLNMNTFQARARVGHAADAFAGGGGKGRHRNYGIRDVMTFAVAGEIIDSGLRDVEKAFGIAAHFALRSTSPHAPRPRLAGYPFDDADGHGTLVAFRGDEVRVIAHKPEEPLFLTSFPPLPDDAEASGLIHIMEVGHLWRRIVAKLGFDPDEELRVVYRP